MLTQFKQKAPRLEARVVSHYFKQQCVVQQELFSGNPKAAQLITHCTIGPTACCLCCMTTMSCFAIKANEVQVQDLRDHYVQAAAENRKLQFLGRKQEQLPYPLWDPDIWTDAYQLGPAKSHKLVYLATDQQKQQYVVKSTQRYGVDAHEAWATAELAPKLLQHRQVAGMWQQVVMEYLPPELPDAAGWLTLRYLMQPLEEQLKAAPQHLILAPELLPQLIQQAERLLCHAHAVSVSGLPAAHRDARPDNIMVCVRNGEVLKLHLIDMDWAGSAGTVVYPALLNTKNIAWPDGVAPDKVLEQKHDIDLLHLQCNRTTQLLVNDWRMMFLTSVQVSEMDVD